VKPTSSGIGTREMVSNAPLEIEQLPQSPTRLPLWMGGTGTPPLKSPTV